MVLWKPAAPQSIVAAWRPQDFRRGWVPTLLSRFVEAGKVSSDDSHTRQPSWASARGM